MFGRMNTMNFDCFWNCIKSLGATAGKTQKGIKYRITPDERLHIKSPRSKNDKHHVSREMSAIYFRKLYLEGMSAKDFKYSHSAWFYDVYANVFGWCKCDEK